MNRDSVLRWLKPTAKDGLFELGILVAAVFFAVCFSWRIWEYGLEFKSRDKVRQRRKTNNPSLTHRSNEGQCMGQGVLLAPNEGQWKASQGFTGNETLTHNIY